MILFTWLLITLDANIIYYFLLYFKLLHFNPKEKKKVKFDFKVIILFVEPQKGYLLLLLLLMLSASYTFDAFSVRGKANSIYQKRWKTKSLFDTERVVCFCQFFNLSRNNSGEWNKI